MLVRPRGHNSIRQLSTDMKMNITIRKTSISKEKWFSNHHFQEIFFLHDGPLRSLWMEWWGPYKWPLYTYRGPNVPPLIPDDGAHPVGAYVCFRRLWSVMESFRTCWSLNDDDFLFGKRNFFRLKVYTLIFHFPNKNWKHWDNRYLIYLASFWEQ